MKNRLSRRFNDPSIASSDITPEQVWVNRRTLLASGLGMAAAGLTGGAARAQAKELTGLDYRVAPEAPPGGEALTPFADVTHYNNFYEFGTDKSDPAQYAHEMTTDPWTVSVGGLVTKPGKLHLEDILSGFDLEERIYRFRCVRHGQWWCLG